MEQFSRSQSYRDWTPGTGAARWLPSASFSVGQAFFTEDPRISVGAMAAGGSARASALASPFERSHSMQLVLEKDFSATEFRVTVGHTTTTQTLGKIDPGQWLTATSRTGEAQLFLPPTCVINSAASPVCKRSFPGRRALLGDNYGDVPQITPEAPRTIFDGLVTLDKLPLGLHARGEYEYVGHKLLDTANASNNYTQFEAIPVGETRLALVRTFIDGRLELGANGMLARGYTGQTTETIAPLASGTPWQVGDGIPSCPAGSGPSGAPNDFDCGSSEGREWAVGIRMASFVGGSVSWRFGGAR